MKTLFKARLNFKLFGFLLNQYRTLMIIFGILLFSAFPLSVITQILRPEFSVLMSTPQPHYIPTAYYFISLCLCVLTPFILFNFTFSKKAVDTFHALPVKRSDLYATVSLSAILIVLIPCVINYIFGYGLAYCFTKLQFSSVHLYTFFRVTGTLLAFASIALLVITNTGTLSEAILYTGIALVIPFFAVGSFSFFSQRFLYGFYDFSELILYYLSPFVSFIQFVDIFRLADSGIDLGILSSYWYLVVIILNVISINIYQRRPSERTEQPFTNSTFFVLLSSTFTSFLLISLMSFFANPKDPSFDIPSLIVPITISLIVFLLLNIIKNRSTKGIKKSIKNFMILLIITLIVTGTYILTGGLGYTTRVPDSKKVNHVVIDKQTAQYFPFLTNQNVDYTINDPESLEIISSFHKDLIHDHHAKNKMMLNDQEQSSDKIPFTFKYVLNNGNTLSRFYFITRTQAIQIMHQIKASETSSPLSRLLESKNTISNSIVFSNHFDQKYHFRGSFETLLNHYENDRSNYTQGAFLAGDKPLKYVLLYQFNQNNYTTEALFVDARFTNTIAYLEASIVSDDTKDDFLEISKVIPSDKSGCSYMPKDGIITYPTVYYLCEQKLNTTTFEDFRDYTPYAYAYKYENFDVAYISLSVQGLSLDIFLPVLKK